MSSAVPAPDQHSIDQYEPTDDPISEHLSDIIRLPGYWPVDESCEELKPVGFCEAGHVQFGSAEPCGLRTCPLHWGQWRKRAAASMVARLAAYRAAQGDRWDPGRRMVHAVTSPDQEQRWTVSRFWRHRSASYESITEAGGRGGAAIPHAFGVSEEGNAAFADAISHGLEPEYGKWRFIRGMADDWEEMRPLVEVHPHVHQLVAVEDFDGEAVEEIEAGTGWVVNNVRSLERFYVDASDALPALTRKERAAARRSGKSEFEALEEMAEEKAMAGYEDMARLSMYLLSHAAVQPETGDLPMRQTVTYWGEVHALDPEEELGREVWETIQKYAAAAVGAPVPDDDEEEGAGRRCSREDCEEPVFPLSELLDRLADPDHSWFDSLAYDQQCELLGVAQWMSHKPPPGIDGPLPPGGFDRSPSTPAGIETEEEFTEWLRRLGRSRAERGELPFLTVGMTPG